MVTAPVGPATKPDQDTSMGGTIVFDNNNTIGGATFKEQIQQPEEQLELDADDTHYMSQDQMDLRPKSSNL